MRYRDDRSRRGDDNATLDHLIGPVRDPAVRDPAVTAPPMAEGIWVVWFDDADVDPVLFFGHGAEAAAQAAYAQFRQSWNCYLLTDHRYFARLLATLDESNTRIAEFLPRVKALLAQQDRLRGALIKRGHSPRCRAAIPVMSGTSYPCDCGLDAILSGKPTPSEDAERRELEQELERPSL